MMLFISKINMYMYMYTTWYRKVTTPLAQCCTKISTVSHSYSFSPRENFDQICSYLFFVHSCASVNAPVPGCEVALTLIWYVDPNSSRSRVTPEVSLSTWRSSQSKVSMFSQDTMKPVNQTCSSSVGGLQETVAFA